METVFKSVATLYILVFLGFFIGKKGIIKPETSPEVSDFIIRVAVPCTIFNSMQSKYDPSMFRAAGQILIITVAFHMLAMVFAMGVVKFMKGLSFNEKGVSIVSCMFSNNGFMGYPLALSLYGNPGLFLMSIANVVSNFLLFSVGKAFITRGSEESGSGISFREMFRPTNINIAVVLGLICYLTQLQLPSVVTDTVTYLANITAGMSMVIVGVSMAKFNVKKMFGGFYTYIITALRLLVIPLITIAVLKILPVEFADTTMATVVLTAALPAPMGITILGEQYKMDTEFGSQIVFMTTLFCTLTIPVLMSIAL